MREFRNDSIIGWSGAPDIIREQTTAIQMHTKAIDHHYLKKRNGLFPFWIRSISFGERKARTHQPTATINADIRQNDKQINKW